MAYTANIVPTMTSNTEPSGVASGCNINPYLAFDNNPATGAQSQGWIDNGLGVVIYQFPTAKTVTAISVVPYSDAGYRSANIAFSGSNNGSDWTQLTSVTGVTWCPHGQTLPTLFEFVNTTAYTYYKLTPSYNKDNWWWVGSLEMYESVVAVGKVLGNAPWSNAKIFGKAPANITKVMGVTMPEQPS